MLEPRLTKDMDQVQAPTEAIKVECERDIATLLDDLTQQTRKLFILREIEGYSLEEVAMATGIEPRTISQRCRRAIAKLEKIAKHDMKGMAPRVGSIRQAVNSNYRLGAREREYMILKIIPMRCRILSEISGLLLLKRIAG